MILRAFYLYFLTIKSFFNRLKSNFVREFVIALCGLIIAVLFYHIFNDFLNHQMNSISLKMRETFAYFLGYCLLLVVGIACGQSLRKYWRVKRSHYNTAKFLGEDPRVLKMVWIFLIPNNLMVYFLPVIYILIKLLYWNLDDLQRYLPFAVILTFVVGFSGILKDQKFELDKTYKMLLKDSPLSCESAMFYWRLKQLLFRNKITKVCCIFAVLLAFLIFFLPNNISPLIFLVSLLAGLMIGISLSFQLSFDLEYSWVEKNLGVSHDQYLWTLIKLSTFLGTMIGFLTCLIHTFTVSFKEIDETWFEIIKIFFIAATPAFLFPNIAFQIDGRKAGIQIMNLILVSIFVATAVYASIFAILLFPLITYYGIDTQRGRFYRA